MSDPALFVSQDLDLVVGGALMRRLRELAEAAAEADGDTGRLADRGFDALAADAARALPPEVRPAFLDVCRRIRAQARRRVRR